MSSNFRLTSAAALSSLNDNNYVVFRNYMDKMDESLITNIFKSKQKIYDQNGNNLECIRLVPQSLMSNDNVNKFYSECFSIYGDNNTFYVIEGVKSKEIATEKHHDLSDVIHWQCVGQSEWTIYNGLYTESKDDFVKVILNAGDVIWFKEGLEHQVINKQDKFSIIFMSNKNLKNHIEKIYKNNGLSF